MQSLSSKYNPVRRSRSRQGRHLVAAREAKRNKPAEPAQPAVPVPNLSAQPAVTPKSSRSAEKLSQFTTSIDTSENEYFIVDSSFLAKLVKSFKCAVCQQSTMDICVQDRQGFAVKFLLQCTVCENPHSELYSSDRIADSESSRPGFPKTIVKDFDSS